MCRHLVVSSRASVASRGTPFASVLSFQIEGGPSTPLRYAQVARDDTRSRTLRQVVAQTFAPRLRTDAREPLVALGRQHRIRRAGGRAGKLIGADRFHRHARAFGD